MEDAGFSEKWNTAFGDTLPQFAVPAYESGKKVATRKVWGPFIEMLADFHPTLVGGSADLEPSNVTLSLIHI